MGRVGAGGRATTEVPMAERLRNLHQKANQPAMVPQQENIEEDIEESAKEAPIPEEEIEESMPQFDESITQSIPKKQAEKPRAAKQAFSLEKDDSDEQV